MIPRRSYLRFERRRTFSMRAVFVSAVALALLAGICVLVFVLLFSRFAAIEYVDVRASDDIDQSAIRSIAFEMMDAKKLTVFSQRNFFMFSTTDLEKKIRGAFAVERLSIRKKFPHSIVVELQASPFRLLWVVQGTVYDISAHGALRQELPENLSVRASVLALRGPSLAPADSLRIPVIFEDGAGTTDIGTEVLSPASLEFVLNEYRLFSDHGMKPRYMMMKRGDPTLILVQKEGWKIYTTILEDPEKQYRNAQTVLSQYGKADRSKLQYIDVRFDNRVYYQ